MTYPAHHFELRSAVGRKPPYHQPDSDFRSEFGGVAASTGAVCSHPAAFRITVGFRLPAPLFGSGTEAAERGQRDIGAPSPAVVHTTGECCSADVAAAAGDLVADSVAHDDQVVVVDIASVDPGCVDGVDESGRVFGLCVDLGLDQGAGRGSACAAAVVVTSGLTADTITWLGGNEYDPLRQCARLQKHLYLVSGPPSYAADSQAHPPARSTTALRKCERDCAVG